MKKVGMDFSIACYLTTMQTLEMLSLRRLNQVRRVEHWVS